MRVFIIDASNMGPELRGGLVGVVGSPHPSAEEKEECVEVVAGYAVEGWAIAADPHTPIGWLAALAAESACVPFVSLSRLPQMRGRQAAVPAGAAPQVSELS